MQAIVFTTLPAGIAIKSAQRETMDLATGRKHLENEDYLGDRVPPSKIQGYVIQYAYSLLEDLRLDTSEGNTEAGYGRPPDRAPP